MCENKFYVCEKCGNLLTSIGNAEIIWCGRKLSPLKIKEADEAHNMNIEKIEILLKAIELGSLTKAANEYSYTPSALSHILTDIENELGAKIICRSYKGIEIEKGYEEGIANLKAIIELKNKPMGD